HFERVILSSDEVIFYQDGSASDAYLIDNGWVNIFRKGPDDQELQIASLSRGSLFGELALIDDKSRSATAIASGRVELIRINRSVFESVISNDVQKLNKLLSIFANRIRETDELAMVMAFSPQTKRVRFALEKLRNDSIPDIKHDGATVIKCGPTNLAKTAGVRETEVMHVLELEKADGRLDYGKNLIRFYDNRN
ncbi:MAG: cyclic nucleotide-binding domain-containing protein, partial [Gammaproteobacteria bacterium]|nr:cyclic nucleotide-binding domain-containing protein [Gammaproteobacteria bacterium]